jgi:hypothetical protein
MTCGRWLPASTSRSLEPLQPRFAATNTILPPGVPARPVLVLLPPQRPRLLQHRQVETLEDGLNDHGLNPGAGDRDALRPTGKILADAVKGPIGLPAPRMVLDASRPVSPASHKSLEQGWARPELGPPRPVAVERPQLLVLAILLDGNVWLMVLGDLDELPHRTPTQRSAAT